MNRRVLMAAAAVLVLTAPAAALAAPSAAILAAVADPARPAADTARDADRKPAEMLDFAGVKPGQTVVDFLPGGGYFTRIFSKAVGPKGAVFALVPAAQTASPDKPPPVKAVADDPAFSNVKVVGADFQGIVLPQPADVIWTSQNYHDLHLKRLNLDVAKVNKSVFNALKPGGYYIVLDHVGATGSGLDAPDAVHRIDPAIVKAELEAAGFKLVAESQALRNTTDDHTKTVFDPAVKGHTDQFIYKFQRPN